jgi:phosphoribosyl-ATP pyrophosphohydrolase/phosphoribosyl-AMP cyclohydrolase
MTTKRDVMTTDRKLSSSEDLAALRFDGDGLVPVVAQDAASGTVLMLAWATREALERTLETGEMHYWSRSRGELWRKGATSGNTQALVTLHADCDGDAVLARLTPAGPACHTGDLTCFGAGTVRGSDESRRGLEDLWHTLEQRAAQRPEGSYTARLLADENLRIKKLGEETAELILALSRGDTSSMAEEAADLLYHTLVALLAQGGSLSEMLRVLDDRRNRRPQHG